MSFKTTRIYRLKGLLREDSPIGYLDRDVPGHRVYSEGVRSVLSPSHCRDRLHNIMFMVISAFAVKSVSGYRLRPASVLCALDSVEVERHLESRDIPFRFRLVDL